jgi:hypothetical protein
MNNYIFLHQYKTGGQTLRNICKYQYGKRIYNIGEKTFSDFLALSEEKKSNIHMIYGHMKFGMHHFLPGISSYLTMIREPVSRIISLYNFIKRPDNNNLGAIIPKKDKKDLKTFVNRIDDYSPIHGNNGMTRLLAGADLQYPPNNLWDQKIKNQIFKDNLLDQALYNIKQHFIFIGTTELYDESLILMKKYLNWNKPLFYIKRNVNRKKEPTYDQETIDLIKEKNRHDIRLYDYVTKQLQQEIQDNKAYINREKRKLAFNNRLYNFYRSKIRKFLK